MVAAADQKRNTTMNLGNSHSGEPERKIQKMIAMEIDVAEKVEEKMIEIIEEDPLCSVSNGSIDMLSCTSMEVEEFGGSPLKRNEEQASHIGSSKF